MIALRNVYHSKAIHLSMLLLTLFFSLTALVSCTQPEPAFTSFNLGIPAAALQSPVKGKLPDKTELHICITFKIDPRLLHQADQQRIQPGQLSPLADLALTTASSQRSKHSSRESTCA